MPYREPGSVVPEKNPACPRCGGELRADRRGPVEIRICGVCQGMWMRADDLRRAVDEADVGALVARPQLMQWVDDGQAIHCPMCGEWMRRVAVQSKPRVIVDACQHGVWLDQGEVETIVAQFPPGADPLERPVSEKKPLDAHDYIVFGFVVAYVVRVCLALL
jgi:Zn-finger nucleic acid-binding protein